MSSDDEVMARNTERAARMFREFLRAVAPDCSLFVSLEIPKGDGTGQVSVHVLSNQDDPNVVLRQAKQAEDSVRAGLAAGTVQQIEAGPARSVDPSPN